MRTRANLFAVTVFALAGAIVFIGCSQWDNLAGTRPAARPGLPAPYIADKDMERLLRSIRPVHGNPHVHYRLARHYQERDRHTEAIKEFWKTVSIDPQYADAFTGMGVSYDLLKDYPKAEIAYRLALKIDPQSDFALNNLGYSCLLQGKFEQAAAYLEEAVKKDGSNKKYRNNLGRAYFSLGRHQEALKEFSVSVGGANANYIAAKLFYEEKMYREAERHFAAALELNPELTAAGKGMEASRAMLRISGDEPVAAQPRERAAEAAATASRPDESAPTGDTAEAKGDAVELPVAVVAATEPADVGHDAENQDVAVTGIAVDKSETREQDTAGTDEVAGLTPAEPAPEEKVELPAVAVSASSAAGLSGRANARRRMKNQWMEAAGRQELRISSGERVEVVVQGDKVRFRPSTMTASSGAQGRIARAPSLAAAGESSPAGISAAASGAAVETAAGIQGHGALRQGPAEGAGSAIVPGGSAANVSSGVGKAAGGASARSDRGAAVSVNAEAVTEGPGPIEAARAGGPVHDNAGEAAGDIAQSPKEAVPEEQGQAQEPEPQTAAGAPPETGARTVEVLAEDISSGSGAAQAEETAPSTAKTVPAAGAADPFVLVRCHVKEENSRSVTVLQFMATSAYLESLQVEVVAGKGKEDLAQSMAGYLSGLGYRNVSYLGEESEARRSTLLQYSSEYLQPAFRIAKDIPGYQEMRSIAGGGEATRAVVRILVGQDMTAHAALFGKKEEYALSSR